MEYLAKFTGMKVSYVGIESATTSMLYALSHREDRLAKVMFACVLQDPVDYEEVQSYSFIRKGLFFFPDHGIHNINGPGWEQNREKICEVFDKEICEWAYKVPEHGIATSVKSEIHSA